jgi:aspartate/methionine/tyrosine aminotransferase
MTAFKKVSKTGVIFVTSEASKLGFYRGNPEWCNFGQGQPEVGKLPGGLERIESIEIPQLDNEYAPAAGLKELRQQIADTYNELYRKDKKSKYTLENVSIAAGGRALLTRMAASLDNVNLGHFLPDYTAYEELLSTFTTFNTIPIMLKPEDGYQFTTQSLRDEITGKGLGALLISNPCNPTGATIHGRQLKDWVNTCTELECNAIMDEFYSSYVWEGVSKGETLSCAKYIEDVNEDGIVIINGLGKNWRYPGYRIAWAVGPKQIITSFNSAGSFLDGGAPRPLQKAAVQLLTPQAWTQETIAIQNTFSKKRQLMLDGLREIGVTFDREPGGSFYLWGNVSDLPEGLNTGMEFLRASLEVNVIAVPGSFFDINPGNRMKKAGSRFNNYLRFSYGPDIKTIETGLQRLKEMVNKRK